jgi:hypothetical protein
MSCGFSRRAFMTRMAGAVTLVGMAFPGTWPALAVPTGRVPDTPIPSGKPLRVKPVLVYHLEQRREKTSWRSYGGLRTQDDVAQEINRIDGELRTLVTKAEFPVTLLPLSTISSDPEVQPVADCAADVFLVFGASGAQSWLEKLAASGKHNILFVRHKSGPVYLWYEIAHWRLLRKSEDEKTEAKRQTDELLALSNVALETERRFVENSFLARNVFRSLMLEQGATNLGVADCMGGLIPILDTPPCLALSLLNDEGLTAFCHVDMTHTAPGVLLRWISGKPSFVCNTHFPHHGLITLAHCAAPRKMNGRESEPTTIMTHYESDYGAATKVHYPKGQVITCIVPELKCTQWFGFRGTIVDSPEMAICRSQMDVKIDGDWRTLVRELRGFHAVVCYGDYLREVGYALKKVGSLAWHNYSPEA